ncbi:BRCT domain-containing protein [Angomonas deanei]|nr:BRCT domain-containing protein [Angomonas deanei]|eukprot:EPY32481.1 BRCT domain-containing protein [Angomonas deanei]
MRRTTVTINQRDLEDRLHRVQSENESLKKERNELEDKLKRVKAQFQRLADDWRRVQPDLNASINVSEGSFGRSDRLPSLTSAKTPKRPSLCSPSATGRSSSAANRELAVCQAALAQAREEIRELQTRSRQSMQMSSPVSNDELLLLRQRVVELTSESQRKSDELMDMKNQLEMAQGNLQRFAAGDVFAAASPSVVPGAASSARAEAAELRKQIQLQFEDETRKIRDERDELALQVRLYEAEKKHHEETASSVDPVKVVELQNEVRVKANEISLLGSRFQSAQSQIETLKGECARLVEELKSSHTSTAEVKKEIFILEQEKSNLEVKCARLDETELQLQRRNEEILRLEANLLKSVDSLNSCNRETEAAVRRELQSRITELQEMRDQADASRREKEKALIDTRSELSDTKRKLESLIEDVALYKGQVAKVEKEKREIAAQLEFAGRPTTELSDDEIHRALAVATIKKRADENKDVGDAPTDEGKEALDLYNALQWDEKWEKAQLEEAISSAALDLELAETRCQQMMEQVEKGRDTLLKLTRERDDLLEENVEMRGRLRHVQTVFAKQQLQTYRTAQARATSSEVEDNGLISFYVREIQYEPEILEQLGIKDYTAAVSLFLSLDGLLDYDTMLSPLVYSLQEPVDIHFQYADLDRRQVTITELQKTSFTFQLHAARGDASAIVAMCELSGTTLMTAREMSQEEVIELIAQDGTCVGRLVVEFTCRRLMLPVLLGTSPVEGNLHLSSAEVTAAMTALRSVRYLRVQVFKCEGLLSQGATPPRTVRLLHRPRAAGRALVYSRYGRVSRQQICHHRPSV